jgi:hypothetical protein
VVRVVEMRRGRRHVGSGFSSLMGRQRRVAGESGWEEHCEGVKCYREVRSW